LPPKHEKCREIPREFDATLRNDPFPLSGTPRSGKQNIFHSHIKQKSTTQYDTISQEDYELLAVCLHASYYSLVVCNRADVFPIRRNPIRRN